MTMILSGSGTGTVGVPNSATVQNANGLTSVLFTGIPAGTKRITVAANALASTGGTFRLQLGASGALVTTGYSGATNNLSSGGVATNAQSSGFDSAYSFVSGVQGGVLVLVLVGNNVWACSGCLYVGSGGGNSLISGNVTLSAALDRVAILTSTGAAFTGGSVNILYE